MTDYVTDERYQRTCGPIHLWFELSYAQYLTIPRSALQSMPIEWQQRFVACLEQLDDEIDWRPQSGRYWVKLKNGDGQYVSDPFMDYRHTPPYPLKSESPSLAPPDSPISHPETTPP